MIQNAGWNRIRTPDEHTKLARVSVDFPSSADSAFELNVSKMRVYLPASLRNGLTGIATAVTRAAEAAFRQRPESGRRKSAQTSGTPTPAGTTASTQPDKGAPRGSSGQDAAKKLVSYILREVEDVIRGQLKPKDPKLAQLITAIATLRARLVDSLAE
jgi:hypothetical protein